VKQNMKFKGYRLRLFYGIHALAARLGLGSTPDKALAMPVSVRKAMRAPGFLTYPLPADVSLERLTIQGRSEPIALKKYLPPRLDPKAPRIYFIHGGGWIHGGLDTLDHLCANLSRDAQCMVVSVEYRLAPETPFPGALEDCDDTLDWIATDPSLGPLPAAGIAVVDAYRGKAELTDPLISPMFAENLADLPPTLIVTADIDPLRDDGARYARKLADAGVPTRYVNYPGMPHGFFFIPRICASAAEGRAEIVRAITALAKR